jgi:urease accessory protein
MNTRRENTLRQCALLCFLLLWSRTAFAHILEGDAAGGFISGFEHPISGWDHILAMVSVGLWGAQLGRRRSGSSRSRSRS